MNARTQIAVALASIGAGASLTTPFSPGHRRLDELDDSAAVASLGRSRTCFAGNPPGSTDPVLRADRRARRKKRMKLRKLRGWR